MTTVVCPLCGQTRRVAGRAWCKQGHQAAEMRALTVVQSVTAVLKGECVMHVYTLKQNAVRAAKKAGLTVEHVRPTAGGFQIVRGQVAAKPKANGKVAKAKPGRPKAEKKDLPAEGTKNRQMIDMLMRPGGATMDELMSTLDWKGPTVRCAVQRVTKSYGLTWARTPGENGAESRWTATRA